MRKGTHPRYLGCGVEERLGHSPEPVLGARWSRGFCTSPRSTREVSRGLGGQALGSWRWMGPAGGANRHLPASGAWGWKGR